MSHYIHNVPGRLRVRSPFLKRNPEAIDELKKALSTLNGIATVDINPTTGSLLVNYNPAQARHADIVGILEQRGYFDAKKAVTHDHYVKNFSVKAGETLTKALFGAVVEMALEGSPLSLLAILL